MSRALVLLCLLLPACVGDVWHVDSRFTRDEEQKIQAAVDSWTAVGATEQLLIFGEKVDVRDTGRRVVVRAGERVALETWEGFARGKVAVRMLRPDSDRIIVAWERIRDDEFQAVMAHEFGHVLGIHHLEDPDALMNETPGADSPTPVDVRALRLARLP